MFELNFKEGSSHGSVYYPPLKSVPQAIEDSDFGGKSVFYRYEPGNATRYEVLFSTYRTPWGLETVMTVVNFGKSMVISGPMHSTSQVWYMKGKLDMNEGDCYALMPLVNHYLEAKEGR